MTWRDKTGPVASTSPRSAWPLEFVDRPVERETNVVQIKRVKRVDERKCG